MHYKILEEIVGHDYRVILNVRRTEPSGRINFPLYSLGSSTGPQTNLSFPLTVGLYTFFLSANSLLELCLLEPVANITIIEFNLI